MSNEEEIILMLRNTSDRELAITIAVKLALLLSEPPPKPPDTPPASSHT
jgi:hypothetical protein